MIIILNYNDAYRVLSNGLDIHAKQKRRHILCPPFQGIALGVQHEKVQFMTLLLEVVIQLRTVMEHMR